MSEELSPEEIKKRDKAAYVKAWHQQNWARVMEHKKKYADANKEKIKKIRERYKPRAKTLNAKRYKENKETVRIRNKAYYEANRERLRAEQKEYNIRNRHRIRLQRRSATYGLSPEVFAEMLKTQNDCCAICKTPFSLAKLNVDHCHKTGEVRGLLCGECNRGLSCFQDNPESLKAAIKYLAKFKAKSKSE